MADFQEVSREGVVVIFKEGRLARWDRLLLEEKRAYEQETRPPHGSHVGRRST